MAADPDFISPPGEISLQKRIGPELRRMIYELRDAWKAIGEQYAAEISRKAPCMDEPLPF
jgi:hypothetical protein